MSEPGFTGLKDMQDYLSELGFTGLGQRTHLSPESC
jgi:hypothetical protein